MKNEDKTKQIINDKGFTLVEILATISILAIIMLMAVPNVIDVVQKGRNKTYVEDAKKMVVLAKYKVKTDASIKKQLKSNESITIALSVLDPGNEIKDAPNGGKYARTSSFVKVDKIDGGYSYYVTIYEIKGNSVQGFENVPYKELLKDKAYKNVIQKTNVNAY